MTVEGLRIHAVVAGSGPDLVLIHGASGSARDFTFGLLPELADRYRVIAFDRPGHGWSRCGTGRRQHRVQARLLQQAAATAGRRTPHRSGPQLWRGGGAGLGGGLPRHAGGPGAGVVAVPPLGHAPAPVLPDDHPAAWARGSGSDDHRLRAARLRERHAHLGVCAAGRAARICPAFRPRDVAAPSRDARQWRPARGAAGPDHRTCAAVSLDKRAGGKRAWHRRRPRWA